MRKGKRFFFYFCVVQLLALSGCSGQTPENRGQFAPCPKTPNCVFTKAADEKHAIDPIPYSGSTADAKERLLKIILSLPGTRVAVDKENFLLVEFTSKILRFVDDTEFYFGHDAALIHFRSASRLGHSDLGANRKRMETIRSRFIASSATPHPKP